MSFRSVQGMFDILPVQTKGEYPAAIEHWQALEQAFRRQAALYGYSEIRTPLLEHTALFQRSIGETTDVVEKEMYDFERHHDRLCLRPEGTASAARAYVQHSVQAQEQVSRWYYLGPMFRAERAQRGRYRQFYQAGCEIFGDPGPGCDAELIEMLVSLFGGLGIGDVSVHLNSLGSAGTRERYRDELSRYLTPLKAELSADSQRRLEKNPLRVLDSKAPEDQAAVAGAPKLLEFLSAEDQAHFAELLQTLDAYGIQYHVEPTLVRGLDYYTRTLFELKSTAGDLGAQNTLCGGGRYDNMIQSLGGQSIPAIGFAMGLERILLSLGELKLPAPKRVFVAPLGKAAALQGLVLARDLRRAGIHTEVDCRGNSMKSMLRRANHLGANVVLVLGESELARGVVQVKDFAPSTEAGAEAAHSGGAGGGKPLEVPLSDVVAHVRQTLGAAA